MNGSTDFDLVGRFLDNRSEEAFRALYGAHSPYLYCLALRLTGGRAAEAEEVVQEAWIRTIRRLESFRWKSALRTWIAGILINCWRERQRRRDDRGQELEPSMRAVDGKATLDRLDLERCVSSLPEGQREVLILFHIEGYSHDEIANLLDIAPGTSKSRLFEARRALRRQLVSEPAGSGGTL